MHGQIMVSNFILTTCDLFEITLKMFHSYICIPNNKQCYMADIEFLKVHNFHIPYCTRNCMKLTQDSYEEISRNKICLKSSTSRQAANFITSTTAHAHNFSLFYQAI